MLATQDKTLENTVEENVLTFYEKIKIKNNLESLFSHYSGSYVFIEVNPWKEEYIIRGKFHVKFGIFAKFEITFDGIEKLRKYSEFIESLAFLKNACDELITPILDDKNNLTFLFGNEYVIKNVRLQGREGRVDYALSSHFSIFEYGIRPTSAVPSWFMKLTWMHSGRTSLISVTTTSTPLYVTSHGPAGVPSSFRWIEVK